MNTKKTHTQGEWGIQYERDAFDSARNKLRIIDANTTHHPQGPLTLATINVAAFAPHMEEPLANARLMAAAPELLGMLKETVRLAELNRHMEADTLRAAKAAIAKAETKIIEDE
jgi:hypothetical protein